MWAGRRRTPKEPLRDRWRASELLLGALVDELMRWAHGLLPARARRRADTGDLVQEAVVEALSTLDDPASRPPGVLRRYLRKAIRNRIRDEIRRAEKVEVGACDERLASFPAPGTSPLDAVLEAEGRALFRRALRSLAEDDRMLVVGRVDLELTYRQLALATGRRSADAAKVATLRAARKLALEVGRRAERPQRVSVESAGSTVESSGGGASATRPAGRNLAESTHRSGGGNASVAWSVKIAPHASIARIGWSVQVKGSSTRPRISRVTAPRSGASPGSPRRTGVVLSPWGSRRRHSETSRSIAVPSASGNAIRRI
jgi:RNA polymerase sigma factor (sigma-70 family)